MSTEERLDAIERRLGSIEELLRKEGSLVARSQKEHIADLRRALDAIASMAETVKYGGSS